MVPDKKSLGGIGDPKCTIAPSDQTLVHRSAQVPLSRRLQGAGSAQSVVTAATTVKGPPSVNGIHQAAGPGVAIELDGSIHT